MDFFLSLWNDPEQYQTPEAENFGADITPEIWMKYSSTYKLISNSFENPEEFAILDTALSSGSLEKTTNSRKRRKQKLPKVRKVKQDSPSEFKEDKISTGQEDNDKGDTDEDEHCEVEAEISSNEDDQQRQFIPGLRRNPFIDKMSCMDVYDHADCLRLFKMFTQAKSDSRPIDRAEQIRFEVMYKKVQEEQKLFCQDAQKRWTETACNSQNVHATRKHVLRIFYTIRKTKVMEYYPHTYKRRAMIPLIPSQKLDIEMIKVSDLLQMGKIPALFFPTLRQRRKARFELCPLLQSTGYTLKKDQIIGSLHKLPVSSDPNAERLARMSKAQIVISSGGLQALLGTYFNFSKSWTLPVRVTEYRTIENGKTTVKTIVLIDKPLPKKVMTADECQQFLAKHGVKKSVLQPNHPRAFEFPVSGVNPLEEEKEEEEMSERKTSEKAEEKQDKATTEEEGPSEEKIPKGRKATTKFIERKDGQRLPKTADGFTPPVSSTNVTYSSWVIRPVEGFSNHKQGKVPREITVIVRCRVDGCRMEGSNVIAASVSPKVEHQIEFTAEEPTKEELVREWASLYFKPVSFIARTRVDWKQAEIVHSEKIDKNHIITDAHRLCNIRLADSLQTLYSVFSEILILTKGSYLLHHGSEEGAFVSLEQHVENAETDGNFTRNLAEELGDDFSVSTDPQPAWRPLDCTLILPKHEVLQVMPATYRPQPPSTSSKFKARCIPKREKPVRPVIAKKKKKKVKKKKQQESDQVNEENSQVSDE